MSGTLAGALGIALGLVAPFHAQGAVLEHSQASKVVLETADPLLQLQPCRVPGVPEELKCGTIEVAENPVRPSGRKLPLKVIVIPARQENSHGPIFMFAGGPGQAATTFARTQSTSWEREKHDIVLVDFRGTGEGNRLDCSMGGSDEEPQSYLEPLFAEGKEYAKCRVELEKVADLTQYTTWNAVADVEKVRRALGYSKINIAGGSYGTRAALTYMRRYPNNVRTAFLLSPVPLENRAPLFHPAAAQRAFDLTVQDCHADPSCKAAFPKPHSDLRHLLAKLRREPALVEVAHPASKKPIKLLLSDAGLGDALRVMLYSAESGRRVPLLLQRARNGELREFAEAAILSSRRLKSSLRTGLLLSFTCGEDVGRIKAEEIEKQTAQSFIGAYRVRGQIEACSVWPKGAVPPAYYDRVASPVPTLIVSGNLDPVTPPEWGDITRSHASNSVHVVVPGGHVPRNECVDALSRHLFTTGDIGGMPRDCASRIQLPPFALPAPKQAK